MSGIVRHSVRSIIQAGGSVAVLVAGFGVSVWLESHWERTWVLGLVWMIVVLVFAPFFLVPLHFRWQSPPESSVVLAFVTGLLAWLTSAACVLLISIYTHGP